MADQADMIMDYQKLFNTVHGKRVLYDLMNHHQVLSSSYSKEASETAFKEGERNVILRIMSLLEMDPREMRKQLKKAKEDHGYYTDAGHFDRNSDREHRSTTSS